MSRLYLLLAFLVTIPALWLWDSGAHPAAPLAAVLFGIAILGAAFLLSWAAEVAQKDISQALAVAILALIAVLPEYAVDMTLAWKAAREPEYGHYALANMTGANRLLVGVGWPAVVLLCLLRFKKKSVKLETSHSNEIFFLGLATLYSIVIPLKGSLGLMDTAVMLAIFGMYAVRVAGAEVHEPELIGPARLIGNFKPAQRRLASLFLFAFSGLAIFASAEPFAEALIETGKSYGISEFLLIQWLAPLASEAPEFIIALIWTFRGDAQAGLGALVSSKVNQWTLLVGTIPIVYSFSLGAPGALPLDTKQDHELWLTAAQSLFAVAILANLSLSWYGALCLFGLFALQLVWEDIRMEVSAVYVVLAILLALRDRKVYPGLFRTVFRR
ncbi:MAG TPA: sodium:calcium antiporter [Candidatus Polarisedimenticolia bacterium]|nr:sodium:calcium antiporter [Candidatus Polarisedimenticolia bacterium]